jgi:hypothetical protein
MIIGTAVKAFSGIMQKKHRTTHGNTAPWLQLFATP